ncbi:MAG: spore germination protein GerW family protein [Armatimonadota bacterium]
MEYQAAMDKLGALKDAATVERVFGEPQTFADRMVIPVAEVRTGMGFGFGMGKPKRGAEGTESGGGNGEKPEGEGAGGGGGAMSRPVGVVEITQQGTNFIPINTPRSAMGFMMLGMALGMALCMMKGRCNHIS